MASVKTALCLFVVVIAATLVSCFGDTPYASCKGVTPTSTIKKLTVDPCPNVPCQLKKGSNVSINVAFTMNSQAVAKNATTSVHGVIAGVSVSYPTDYTDACKTAGLTCPLKSGADYIYAAKLHVETFFPSINLYVKWELKDETSKDIFCFMIPVTIVSG